MKKVDVEALLIWAYVEQKVGTVLGGGRRIRGGGGPEQEPCGASLDGVLTMERIGQLGCLVRGGGGAWGGSASVARDAETVHQVVEGLRGGVVRDVRGLVRRCAETAAPPDWVPMPAPRAFAKFGTYIDGRGRPQACEYVVDPDRSGIGRQPWYAEVDYRDMPEMVHAKRTLYFAWWDALHGIATFFEEHRTLLVDHVVTGFRRPPMPWEKNFG